MMKQVEIISKLPTVFTRKLEEGQELCPECGGIQLVYDGKFITSCLSCMGRNGVLSRCRYCGELLVYSHKCQGMKEVEAAERRGKENSQWDKAAKITLAEAIERLEMVFVDWGDGYYVEPDILLDWIEEREADDEDFDRTDFRVYGTYKTQISFDAGNIIESACDDLHEEAMERIPREAITELQELLDKWAEKYGGGTTTYWDDKKIGIILPSKEGLNDV